MENKKYSSCYTISSNIVAGATNVFSSASLGTARSTIQITSLCFSVQFIDATTGTAVSGFCSISPSVALNTAYSTLIPGITNNYSNSLVYYVYSNLYTISNFIISAGDAFSFTNIWRIYATSVNTITASTSIIVNYDLY